MKLYEFQEKAITQLIDLTVKADTKQIIQLKSPTGSGKTIILLNFINSYLNRINKNTAIIWLCPGKGNLEEQSMKKMQQFFPQMNCQDLSSALNFGFVPQSTTFINWELVTKTGNKAITESEKKNLFDRIDESHRSKTDFIVIIDEEHSNNTGKAQEIIDALYAKKIIRVSATPQKNPKFEFIEIDESEVIAEGLITKMIRVNAGIEPGQVLGNDYDELLTLADKKRKEIQDAYKNLNKTIRPLVLIQFPNAQPETIKLVENKLQSMGYTYDNGMVAKWTSAEKRNLDESLVQNDGVPVFLLMKQAITTGWDCPRAKILVKLREGMEQNFEIQTIGRIRRMPELMHYENPILDYCYVYTYDEKWKTGLVDVVANAYEFVKLFLNNKCRDFHLKKQLKDANVSTGLGERETLNCLIQYFKKTYSLSNDKNKNKKILESNDYIFGTKIKAKVVQTDLKKILNVDDVKIKFIDIVRETDTHEHGMLLQHNINDLRKILGLDDWPKTHVILKKLFKSDCTCKNKICSLETNEFYAFIINNIEKLKKDFIQATAQVYQQNKLALAPKEVDFTIPVADEFKYDSLAKKIVDFTKNAYKDYTSANCTSRIRSNSEILFENFCEHNENVEWFYKNGDSGQQYFSIVYFNGVNKQQLFYPDYIVKMKNGDTWIIETKGGEIKGENKNVDIQIENKFNAFKEYAEAKNIKWGFVRYVDQSLYINNTKFALDMNDDAWVPISEVIK